MYFFAVDRLLLSHLFGHIVGNKLVIFTELDRAGTIKVTIIDKTITKSVTSRYNRPK